MTHNGQFLVSITSRYSLDGMTLTIFSTIYTNKYKTVQQHKNTTEKPETQQQKSAQPKSLEITIKDKRFHSAVKKKLTTNKQQYQKFFKYSHDFEWFKRKQPNDTTTTTATKKMDIITSISEEIRGVLVVVSF